LSSENVEEYLEAIHGFNEKGQPARTTELADKLGVSPPSVTEMIKKLAEEGLLEYEPYKGVLLSGKGMAYAQKIVRKHRLLERFLYDFLGLKRDRVHQEACKLEHGLSDDVADALCRIMEKPELCPDDGNPIPPCLLDVKDCEGCASARNKEHNNPRLVVQLSNFRVEDEGVVAFVRGGKNACKRLLDMGLTPGTPVRVISAAPFKGPMEITVRGTTVAVGRGLASSVFVEIEQELSDLHPHHCSPQEASRPRGRHD